MEKIEKEKFINMYLIDDKSVIGNVQGLYNLRKDLGAFKTQSEARKKAVELNLKYYDIDKVSDITDEPEKLMNQLGYKVKIKYESQKKYNKKYNKEKYKRFGLMFRKDGKYPNDLKIIDKLSSQLSPTNYIRKLVIEDIERNDNKC